MKDIYPGPSDSYVTHLTAVNSSVYFFADDGSHGTELRKSDGTKTGTGMVKDLNPGPSGSIAATPQSFTPQIMQVTADGEVLFTASDGVSGVELWRTDGTAAGTQLVQDIAPGPSSSNPANITVAGSYVFFSADDGLGAGIQIIKSEGAVPERIGFA